MKNKNYNQPKETDVPTNLETPRYKMVTQAAEDGWLGIVLLLLTGMVSWISTRNPGFEMVNVRQHPTKTHINIVTILEST